MTDGEMQSYEREIERLRTQAQVDAEMITRESEFSLVPPSEKAAEPAEFHFFKRLLDEDFRVSEAEARRMAHTEANPRPKPHRFRRQTLSTWYRNLYGCWRYT